MDKIELIEITNKLYRKTILFPKKEPLRYKIRELADEILSDFIILENLMNFEHKNVNQVNYSLRFLDVAQLLKTNLEIINSYLEVAKWQNWISPFEIMEIQGEYGKTQSEIIGKIDIQKINFLEEQKIETVLGNFKKGEKADSQSLPAPDMEDRKDKILEFLKEKGRAQVWEVNEVFPDVSKRTLRRDFSKLLEKGVIERIGEKNNTFYQLKREEV